MPCDSSHMEATQPEKSSRELAGHMVYVAECYNTKPAPEILKASKDYYGRPSMLTEWTQKLCNICRSMNEDELNRVIYNAHDKRARRLADWWEAHQKEDSRREKQELIEERCIAVKLKIKKALTPAELETLREHLNFDI